MKQRRTISPEEKSAWLAAKVTVFCAFLAVVVQIAGYFLASRDKQREEVMQHRRKALISALEVVDHVYANITFNQTAPTNPHQWDISLARSSMNEIIIYCKDPNRVLAAFSKAIGLYNPQTQNASPFAPSALAEFRNVICEELDVSPIRYADSNLVWIATLPGGK